MLINRRGVDATTVADLWFFNAVARAGSVRQAARELSLTQSAVSQRIQRLEARLDVPLFYRGTRSLHLTPKGAELLSSVVMGFDHIAQGVGNILDPAPPSTVRVSCTPSLALEWLTPRISDLNRVEPDISVTVFAEMTELTRDIMINNNIDIAIRYELRDRASLSATDSLIVGEYDEFVAPLCSQKFKADLERSENAPGLTLLHDASPWIGAASDEEWSLWLDAHPDMPAEPRKDLFFNLAQLAYRAAISNVGVAFGRSFLVHHYLLDGQLQFLWEGFSRGPTVYRIYALNEPAENSSEHRFLAWLHAQMDAMPKYR